MVRVEPPHLLVWAKPDSTWAWQAIAGLSADLSDNVQLFAEYKYRDMLDAVAGKLLEVETISREEFEKFNQTLVLGPGGLTIFFGPPRDGYRGSVGSGWYLFGGVDARGEAEAREVSLGVPVPDGGVMLPEGYLAAAYDAMSSRLKGMLEGLMALHEAGEKGSEDMKQELIDSVCAALTVHMQIEEEIFYPAFGRATGDDKLLQEGEREHREARELIAKVDAEPANGKLMLELEDAILHHVNDEREKMFPKARSAGMNVDYVVERKYDGVGKKDRIGLNFTEVGVAKRGSVTLYDRGHTATSGMKPGDVNWNKLFKEDGVRWLHTGGIFSALSADTRAVVAEAVKAAARECGTIVTVEDHWPEGGLGDAVLEALAEAVR